MGEDLHLVDQTLEAVFEFALDSGPGLQQRQVQSPHGDVLQHRRHVALGDAQGEAFHHGGLADTGFADQDGVVLAAAGQDIDHLADLEIARQHRVHFALAGVLGQVDGVLIEVGGLAARGARRAFRRGGFGGSAISSLSTEVATMLRKSFLRASAGIFCSSLLTSRTMRASSSSETSARMVKPVRMRVAPKSIEPMVQASVSIFSSDGLSAGVRALPLLSLSRLRVSSADKARLVDAELFQDEGEVSVARIEQLHQVMLDFDVVVRPGQAESRGSLQRQARRIVQFRDE